MKIVKTAATLILSLAAAIGTFLISSAVPGITQEPVSPPSPSYASSPPQRLLIPKLNVDTRIEYVSEDSQGIMASPVDPDNVAWYEPGIRPGEKGNAVIAGHVDSKDGPAIFYELNNLSPGDNISVATESGDAISFRVTGKATYPADNFPIHEVFGASAKKRLNLITCTGEFDSSAKQYADRLVIYSEQTHPSE